MLFNLCEKDNINSSDSNEKIENILGEKIKIVKYPIGHFDIYSVEYFEASIINQIAFQKNTFRISESKDV